MRARQEGAVPVKWIVAAIIAAFAWAVYDLNKTLTRALRLPEEP